MPLPVSPFTIWCSIIWSWIRECLLQPHATWKVQNLIFASRDPWCRPVMTRTGPEGALWVVDMYRYMIEHPQWLPEAGKQELLPNYRLGEDRGRIYRILPEHQPAKPLRRLSEWSNKALVDGLVTDHGWVRDKIHMMLVWKKDPEIPALLEGLLEKTPHVKARLHAMWILKPKAISHPVDLPGMGLKGCWNAL